jgi:hypothetical protein
MTYDGTNLRGYRNGTLVGTLATSGSGSGGANAFVIGGYSGQRASMYIDEVRSMNAVRSGDWIAAESLNMLSPETFYTITGFLPPTPFTPSNSLAFAGL